MIDKKTKKQLREWAKDKGVSNEMALFVNGFSDEELSEMLVKQEEEDKEMYDWIDSLEKDKEGRFTILV